MNTGDPGMTGGTEPAIESTPTTDNPADLDAILDRLDDQDALVHRARESLEHTLNGLKLTPEEEGALAEELHALRGLADKLEDQRIEIAAFGMVSRGKSSVLNALLGRPAFQAGSTHGTTTVKEAQTWDSVTVSGLSEGDARLVLVDTPGIDEVGGEVRETLARDIARHADLILFVVSSDMQRREFDALEQLRQAQKPIILVFNQIDRYPDVDRDLIHSKLRDERVRHLIRPEDVVMTAARPDPYRVRIQHADGTSQIVWESPEPIITPLKTRILEVLEREGKALVALNTLLFAGDLHQEIVAHKIRIRDAAASRLIWNFSLTKGATVGLNPIPVADMAGGLAVDVGMVVGLSKLYGIPLTRKAAAGLIKDMVKVMGALGAVEVTSRLAVSGLKATLVGASVASMGLTLAGYGMIALAMGATAGWTSYVLGHGTKVYLQHGCQWGERGIKTVIADILDQARNDSVMERLRDDLRKKITS